MVDTHLRVPDEIHRVVIQATGPGGMARALDAPLAGPSGIELPLTLGLVAGNPRLEGVEVTASAFGMTPAGELEISRQLVRTSFTRNERRLLHIVLWPACPGDACPDQHCDADGSCSPPDVAGDALPLFEAVPGRVGDPCAAGTSNARTTIGCNGGPIGPKTPNVLGGTCPLSMVERFCSDMSLCLGFDETTGMCGARCEPGLEYANRSNCPFGFRCFGAFCYQDCNADTDCTLGICDLDGSCVAGGAPPPDAGVPGG